MKNGVKISLAIIGVFLIVCELIPVTVVEASQNVVLQKKTEEVDGYNAIQVGFEDKQAYKKGSKSNKYANKPAEGHAKKS